MGAGVRSQNSNFSKSTYGRANHQTNTRSRPKTAVDPRMLQDSIAYPDERSGMPSSPYMSPRTLPPPTSLLKHRKIRQAQSLDTLRGASVKEKYRGVSISTAMSSLRIDEDTEDQGSEIKSRSSVLLHSNVNSRARRPKRSVQNLRANGQETAVVPSQASPDTLVAPQTPSFIPIPASKVAAPAPTPSKSAMCSTPVTQRFLSKDSNLKSFTGWDIDRRLKGVDDMMDKFKTAAEANFEDRSTLLNEIVEKKGKSKCFELGKSSLTKL